MAEKAAEIKRLTFMQAKGAVKAMAGGKYHSVQFGLDEHADGQIVPECKCYIDDVGWTAAHRTWENALADMEEMIRQKDQPETVEEMAPMMPGEVV